MRQLLRSENDVANGVDASLGGLHPFVGLDEAALRLNACLVKSNAVGVGLASDRDQNLFRFNLLLLAVCRKCHRNPGLSLLDFLNLCIALKINAPLAIDAGKFLRHIFIFERHYSRKHLDDVYLAIE